MVNKLKQARIKAMKDHDAIAKSILSVLYSEALTIAKKEIRDVTDSDIIKSAKSLIKRNTQTLDLIKDKDNTIITLRLLSENGILETYLPEQLSEEEIHKAVDIIIDTLDIDTLERKHQGMIMKELKLLGDIVNMGIASKYVSSKI